MRAIVPAAGLGTRRLPITRAVPKEMFPVGDLPAIHLILEEAVAAGATDIAIVTREGKESIERYFDRDFLLTDHPRLDRLRELRARCRSLVAIYQPSPRGLGDAIYAARTWAKDEPVAVLLGDDVVLADKPCIQQVVEAIGKDEAGFAAHLVPEHLQASSGMVTAEQNGRCLGLVEKPPAGTVTSGLGVVGRYILPSAIWEALERACQETSGEIQLTTALADLITRGTVTKAVRFQGRKFDIGDPIERAELTLLEALRDPATHQDAALAVNRLRALGGALGGDLPKVELDPV